LVCPQFLVFSHCGDPPHLHSFPTRRSSDLVAAVDRADVARRQPEVGEARRSAADTVVELVEFEAPAGRRVDDRGRARIPRSIDADRKSTRLNSSHRTTSYAVFCLKKKNQTQ